MEGIFWGSSLTVFYRLLGALNLKGRTGPVVVGTKSSVQIAGYDKEGNSSRGLFSLDCNSEASPALREQAMSTPPIRWRADCELNCTLVMIS